MKYMEKFIVKMVAKADKSQSAIDVTNDISAISEDTINNFAVSVNDA